MIHMDHMIFKSYKVPKEDLLVWNVKDGWKPLCEFLQCPVPKIPIPHDNRTGDTKFIEGKSSKNSRLRYKFILYHTL